MLLNWGLLGIIAFLIHWLILASKYSGHRYAFFESLRVGWWLIFFGPCSIVLLLAAYILVLFKR